MVFDGARQKLGRAVAVHTEVCFLPLYKNQPLFGEIDLALRGLGFVLHDIHHMNRRTILPLYDRSSPNSSVNQIIFADVVYVRDFSNGDAMNDEQLKHLALVAHHCYRSFDLTVHCLFRLAGRNAVPADAVDRYIESTMTAARAAG
jgi:hypothetical protein